MPTLTYDPTPADQPEFRESELEALKVGEQQAAAEDGLLAGKFKSPQDLEQAYIELQKKLGAPRDEVPTTDQGEAEAAPEEEVEQEEEEQPTGKITEQQALELQNMCGGPKGYNAMLKWAAQTLNDAEVEMFDGVIAQGDPNSCFFAVQNLFTRYQDATGSDGTLLTGSGAVDKQDVFRSQQEVVAAMSDPRYEKDPAYRQDVFDKLERSQIQY